MKIGENVVSESKEPANHSFQPKLSFRRISVTKLMTTQPVPICGEHSTSKEWASTIFAYDEEGISVRVPHVQAWVCPIDGEASFTAETVES